LCQCVWYIGVQVSVSTERLSKGAIECVRLAFVNTLSSVHHNCGLGFGRECIEIVKTQA
jgi:hypothetical protein